MIVLLAAIAYSIFLCTGICFIHLFMPPAYKQPDHIIFEMKLNSWIELKSTKQKQHKNKIDTLITDNTATQLSSNTAHTNTLLKLDQIAILSSELKFLLYKQPYVCFLEQRMPFFSQLKCFPCKHSAEHMEIKHCQHCECKDLFVNDHPACKTNMHKIVITDDYSSKYR